MQIFCDDKNKTELYQIIKMQDKHSVRTANYRIISKFYFILKFYVIILIFGNSVLAQRTYLDDKFEPIYRPFRLLALNLIGRSGEGRNLQLSRSFGKVQDEIPGSQPFFCDGKNGPGRRSKVPPTSVHRLRPGDVDIIAGMGDSLTAGNGIMSTNLLHITVENRGMSWSIGGQGTWRKYLTIPNILKNFNPNLYGYSLKDGIATDRSSKFNVAELGAMSRDMFWQAKVLVARLKHDPRVNMTGHWKLLTLLIGNNDFCSDICYYPNPESTVQMHKTNMLKTLRYLRDNIPRLMINMLSAPDVSFLLDLKGKPQQCYYTHPFECPCFIGKSNESRRRFQQIINKWVEVDKQVAYSNEFNREDFTINLQKFTRNVKFPQKSNGIEDYSYFAEDCFHLSQKGQARSANAFWNNLLEPENRKYDNWHKEFEVFKCPTNERPYIATRENSF